MNNQWIGSGTLRLELGCQNSKTKVQSNRAKSIASENALFNGDRKISTYIGQI